MEPAEPEVRVVKERRVVPVEPVNKAGRADSVVPQAMVAMEVRDLTVPMEATVGTLRSVAVVAMVPPVVSVDRVDKVNKVVRVEPGASAEPVASVAREVQAGSVAMGSSAESAEQVPTVVTAATEWQEMQAPTPTWKGKGRSPVRTELQELVELMVLTGRVPEVREPPERMGLRLGMVLPSTGAQRERTEPMG